MTQQYFGTKITGEIADATSRPGQRPDIENKDRTGLSFRDRRVAKGARHPGRSAASILRVRPRGPANENGADPTCDVETSGGPIVVIDARTLVRDCLVKCLKDASEGSFIFPYSSVREWLDDGATARHPRVVMICNASSRGLAKPDESGLSLISDAGIDAPIIVISDTEDGEQIAAALEKGARGYIPTSVTLGVAVRAVRLVEAGGTFVPASTVLTSLRGADHRPHNGLTFNGLFTHRQSAVLAGLRQGKANKLIAHELGMSEGTVKVHIREIMKKLNARNRTEVVLRTSAMTEEP